MPNCGRPAHSRRNRYTLGLIVPAVQHAGDLASWKPALLPERKRLSFIITTGRSGIVLLTELFRANFGPTAMELHRQRTNDANLAYQTPDSGHLLQFNGLGNTTDVIKSWRRKFALIRRVDEPNYVETSHFLAKAARVENIVYLNPAAQINRTSAKPDPARISRSIRSL